MEIDVGVQELSAEGIDFPGKALRNVAVAQVFGYDRPVLRFSQPIVIAVPGRDLVKSTRSFSRRLATVWLMYPEP